MKQVPHLNITIKTHILFTHTRDVQQPRKNNKSNQTIPPKIKFVTMKKNKRRRDVFAQNKKKNKYTATKGNKKNPKPKTYKIQKNHKIKKSYQATNTKPN